MPAAVVTLGNSCEHSKALTFVEQTCLVQRHVGQMWGCAVDRGSRKRVLDAGAEVLREGRKPSPTTHPFENAFAFLQGLGRGETLWGVP